MTKQVDGGGVIDCFVNCLCKVCWRTLLCGGVEDPRKSMKQLSHPPTPPPALLPAFAGWPPRWAKPEPTFPQQLFLEMSLPPPHHTSCIISLLSYATATHCYFFYWLFLPLSFLPTAFLLSLRDHVRQRLKPDCHISSSHERNILFSDLNRKKKQIKSSPVQHIQRWFEKQLKVDLCSAQSVRSGFTHHSLQDTYWKHSE